MKLIYCIFIVSFSLIVSSCTPSMFFEIENLTTEQIKIEYDIRDDFLVEGYDKTIIQ